MSVRRSIHWSAAIHGVRSERRPLAAAVTGFIRADGTFNLTAIMREAVARARRFRRSVRACVITWKGAMKNALRQVWKAAKLEQAARSLVKAA